MSERERERKRFIHTHTLTHSRINPRSAMLSCDDGMLDFIDPA